MCLLQFRRLSIEIFIIDCKKSNCQLYPYCKKNMFADCKIKMGESLPCALRVIKEQRERIFNSSKREKRKSRACSFSEVRKGWQIFEDGEVTAKMESRQNVAKSRSIPDVSKLAAEKEEGKVWRLERRRGHRPFSQKAAPSSQTFSDLIFGLVYSQAYDWKSS